MTAHIPTRFAALVLSGLLLATAAGCSGTSLTGPSAVPAQKVRLTGVALDTVFQDLLVERGGMLTATLTWEYSNNVDITVTEASCGTRDFYGCAILGASRSPRGIMTEQVIAAVHAGHTLRFWIANVDDATAAHYVLDVLIQ